MRYANARNKFMYTCPVCGYTGLEEPHRQQHGSPSFEICSCCGIEFGYHDARRSHAELRKEWIEEGMPWHHPPVPEGWDPKVQLRAAGLEVE